MKLGVVGYGLRATGVTTSLNKFDDDLKITGLVDPASDLSIKRMNDRKINHEGMKLYDTLEDMMSEKNFDALLIATHCDLHTDLVIKAMEASVPIFLEKPVSMTFEQLSRLNKARKDFDPNVLVSFPLRLTTIALAAKKIIESGEIGTVEQVQAHNNVAYGNVYFKNWYRDDSVTGGLWLQKATHDFDYINNILGVQPVQVCAMESKQIFKGNKSANLKCIDCNEYKTCSESTWVLEKFANAPAEGEYCSFAVDTGNMDSGSAILRYESGMHTAYTQNFFIRKSSAARGAKFMGYKGSLEFDWYTGEIKVHHHFTPRVDTYKFDSGESHFGGDGVLVTSFMKMVYEGAKSTSTLAEGLKSANVCLCTKKSAETKSFIDIPNLDNI